MSDRTDRGLILSDIVLPETRKLTHVDITLSLRHIHRFWVAILKYARMSRRLKLFYFYARGRETTGLSNLRAKLTEEAREQMS